MLESGWNAASFIMIAFSTWLMQLIVFSMATGNPRSQWSKATSLPFSIHNLICIVSHACAGVAAWLVWRNGGWIENKIELSFFVTVMPFLVLSSWFLWELQLHLTAIMCYLICISFVVSIDVLFFISGQLQGWLMLIFVLCNVLNVVIAWNYWGVDRSNHHAASEEQFSVAPIDSAESSVIPAVKTQGMMKIIGGNSNNSNAGTILQRMKKQ